MSIIPRVASKARPMSSSAVFSGVMPSSMAIGCPSCLWCVTPMVGKSCQPDRSWGSARYSCTMADDRSYVEANTRERDRLRALVDRLDDDALMAPVNDYWTVAGVLGHTAYWEIRVL